MGVARASSEVSTQGTLHRTRSGGPQGSVGGSEKSTYRQILKSSALVGVSSVIGVCLGIIRAKVVAVMLGPTGTGLMGLYGSAVDVVQSVAGMGVGSSGVQQIAQAAASGDDGRIARTVVLVRRVSVVLGLLGAGLLFLGAKPASRLTFGSDGQASAMALVSLAVLFRVASAGEGALLQGTRRIADLAKTGVWGTLFGTLATVCLVYVFGEKGVVASLVATAGIALVASWWYSRRVLLAAPAAPASPQAGEARKLLQLGFAFMVTGLMTTGASWLIRVIVLRGLGFEAAGLYQSAWTIGGVYVGFILGAMGADFYPRLAAIVDRNAECNRVVNEQVRVGLLMAAPGVLATLTFTPLVISVLYTSQFEAAVGPLRWLCLGMSLRVITWPMGFIVVARGLQTLFIGIDLVCSLVHVGIAWLCIRFFGLDGAGMAFFGLYVFHACLIYPIARRLTGFRLSPANQQTIAAFVAATALVFLGFHLLPAALATVLGTAAVALTAAYSARVLAMLALQGGMPPAVRRLLVRLRLAAPGADR
jgi:O-antigen/teichoic acid export membrane protein